MIALHSDPQVGADRHCAPGPASPDPISTRIGSIDILRLGAISVVALRHLGSITGEPWLEPPQYLGLGTFCALSGWLAMQGQVHRSPHAWLARRLERVLPSYWLALTAIVIATYLSGYKPVDWRVVAAQYAGLAHWLYPGQGLGVHTWFISLILLCYAAAALVRAHPAWLAPWAVLVSWSLVSDDKFAGCHAAFLTGVVAARLQPLLHLATAPALLACLFASGLATGIDLGYPIAGCAMLGLAGIWSPSPRLSAALRPFACLVYEVYLVHGPIFVGLHEFLGLGWARLALMGVPASFLAAWILREAANRGLRPILQHQLRRKLGGAAEQIAPALTPT